MGCFSNQYGVSEVEKDKKGLTFLKADMKKYANLFAVCYFVTVTFKNLVCHGRKRLQ